MTPRDSIAMAIVVGNTILMLLRPTRLFHDSAAAGGSSYPHDNASKTTLTIPITFSSSSLITTR